MLSTIAQRGRKIAGVAAALCLAASLCACQGGTREESVGSTDTAVNVTGQDLLRFQELTEMFPSDRTYTYREECVVGEEGNQATFISDYTVKASGYGSEARAEIQFGEEDTLQAGTNAYFADGKTVQVFEDQPVDVTATRPFDLALWNTGELLEGFSFGIDDLRGVSVDGEDTVYQFKKTGGPFPGIGEVLSATNLEATLRFDFQGVLVEESYEAEGSAMRNGAKVPASTSIVVSYESWGNVEIAELPEAEGVAEEGNVSDVRTLLESAVRSLPDNFSCQTQATVEGPSGSTDLYSEALIDRSDGFVCALYAEIGEGNGGGTLTLFENGDSAVIENEEVTWIGEAEMPSDPEGIEKPLSILAAASDATIYRWDEGITEYAMTVDPLKLGEGIAFDGVARIDDLQVNYCVNEDGTLNQVIMAVGGIAEDGGEISMDSVTFYYDYGTTEVPRVSEL